jgi:type IV secretion system protein VirD4
MHVFDYIDEQRKEAQIREQKRQGLSDYFSRFHLWLRHEPVPDVPDDSKGSRFSTPSETAALLKPNGAPYGYVEGRPYFLDTEKHILIQASTRSGKGVAVIIPRLLTYPGSAFVLDPKGENGRATGRRRAELNDKVHYLDPFGISGKPKSRFNPLSRFTPENMEAESKALAAALVLADTRDHWIAAGQQLLAALIMHVYSSPDIAPANKDLVTVRGYLLGRLKLTLEEMAKSKNADGLIAALAQSFLDTPREEFGSIISTAQRETEILDNPEIKKSLLATGEGDEVDFAQWHRGTMTVFLCLAAPKFPVFSRWLRLVLTSALDEMTDKLRPPPLPVVFLLDELATLGHLSTVENAIGLSAGYGVQIVSVFQDVAQMRDLYKGRWTSFVGNAGVRVLFNLDDFETAEYWSKFIGGRLVETLNVSEDIYGIAEKQSRGEAVRPLLTPDEIMLRFAGGDLIEPETPGGLVTMGKMLLLPQGSRPIIADRVPYFVDPNLKGLWDDPRVRQTIEASATAVDLDVESSGFVATAWKNSVSWESAAYGLKITREDRDKFFKREWKTVSLRLPNGVIATANVDKDSFWNDTCRELISAEIGAWLRDAKLAPWPDRSPPRVEIIPESAQSFRVQPCDNTGDEQKES